jgi:predicted amidophosphoribosyltransferase
MDAKSCALLPASCSLCGSPPPQLSHVPICAVCWTEFSVRSAPACARCGDGLDIPKSTLSPACAFLSCASLSRTCPLDPPPFSHAVACGFYRNPVRAPIHAFRHAFKYDQLNPVASRLGRILAQSIAQLAEKHPAELLVVSVRLRRSKHTERGFDRARMLAGHAIGFLRKTHPAWKRSLASSTFIRLRTKESQADLKSRTRRLNFQDAFTVFDRGAVAIRARAHCADKVHRGSNFQDVLDDIGLPGNSPAGAVRNASIYSSHHQPSF